jgi:uncharacterized membrane protein
MSMRLQEVHPALVHYPIALLPTALGADALGRLTRSEPLLEIGRRLTPIAAGATLVAGLFGFVAQETVRTDETGQELLATHRTLNIGLVALAAALAGKRARMRRPTLGYLAVGAAGIGVMAYSAYLGGKMVYHHGIGVSAANGLIEEEAPEITPSSLPEVAAVTADHLRAGIEHTLTSAPHFVEPEAAEPAAWESSPHAVGDAPHANAHAAD